MKKWVAVLAFAALARLLQTQVGYRGSVAMDLWDHDAATRRCISWWERFRYALPYLSFGSSKCKI